MEINIIIALTLFFIFGIIIGYLTGSFNQNNENGNNSNIKPITGCGVTEEELERMPMWNIVRYKTSGEYDCVWSGMHTKRDADKRCKELNEDYHKNYGKYVVERNSCI